MHGAAGRAGVGMRTEIDELPYVVGGALRELLAVDPLGGVHAARRDSRVLKGILTRGRTRISSASRMPFAHSSS